MIGWIVFGSILLLLLLLLFSPVSVKFTAKDGGYTARARYLFLRLDLSAEAMEKRSQKKASKKPGKEKPKKEKEAPEEEPPKKKKSGLDTVLKVLRSSRKGVGILRRHLIFSKIRVYLRVGGDDAHQAAIRYSQFGMLVAGILDVIGVLFVLKKPKVGILPDFTHPQVRYEISGRVFIRPVFVLGAGISVFYRFFRTLMDAKKQPKKPVKPVKTKKAS